MSDVQKPQYLTEAYIAEKQAVMENLSPSMANIVSTLIDNTVPLYETAGVNTIQTSDISNMRKTLMPLIRRIIPGTIATELVGVQPLSGPVGLINTFKYHYAEDVKHTPRNSIFGGYDINRMDEAFGNLSPLRQFYSGTVGAGVPSGASGSGPAAPGVITDTTGIGTGWFSEDANRVTRYDTGEMSFDGMYDIPVGGTMLGGGGGMIEGSGGRAMTMQLRQQAVEAQTRKLQASWTIEAMQDAASQHNINVESEMVKALGAQIAQEIDAQIINEVFALAGTVRNYDFLSSMGPSYAPAFVGDRYANIATVINEISAEIARKTRIADGANWILASSTIIAMLQSATRSVFAPAILGDFKAPNNNKMVGTLNGKYKVYSYLWNQEGLQVGSSSGATNKILLGFKGGDGETNAGYFYCPYIPVMSSGVVTNPDTYNHGLSLMTRYGVAAFTDPNLSLGNSADYYARLNITNLTQY